MQLPRPVGAAASGEVSLLTPPLKTLEIKRLQSKTTSLNEEHLPEKSSACFSSYKRDAGEDILQGAV